MYQVFLSPKFPHSHLPQGGYMFRDQLGDDDVVRTNDLIGLLYRMVCHPHPLLRPASSHAVQETQQHQDFSNWPQTHRDKK